MIAPREMVVDLFAGGGGASLGITWALGRHPDIAIDHDREAIAMHRANHPETRHYTEDVWQVDPVSACAGRPVGLLWLSPDCRHFSKAKSGKPVSKRVRGLAWVAVRWAIHVRPRVIALENVEEFQTWGPLGPDGRPCPRRQGLTFRRFVGRLRTLGYQVEWRELRAADYGARTTRKRLFLIARCDGEPIRWPRPTHGRGCPQPWRPAAECIDWSIPCPSIFDRPKPLVENTVARIASGIRRFVLDDPDPFITELPRRRGADQPEMVAAFLARHFTGVDGISLRKPLPTITTRDHHALVTCRTGEPQEQTEAVRAFLLAYFGSERDGSSLRRPMRTITTRDRFALVVVHGRRTITDIGHRMLTPRELYYAQSFDPAYEIEQGIDEEGNIIRLTRSAQVRMCGNSVAPVMAEAVVRAQFGCADVEMDLFSAVGLT